MRYCLRCGGSIHDRQRFCRDCGLPITERRQLPWRQALICLLLAWTALGTAYLVHDWLARGVTSASVAREDPLAGTITGETLRDSREYAGGVIDRYDAFDFEGNPMVVLRDRDTGAVQAFAVTMAPAVSGVLSLDRARRIAHRLASRVEFYDDPNLILDEEGMDRNVVIAGQPDFAPHYYFVWRSIDRGPGTHLLRFIRIHVHAGNGRVVMFASYDGGEVTVPTEPLITSGQAQSLALSEAGSHLSEPRLVRQMLYVSNMYDGQRLVWEALVEEALVDDVPVSLAVVVDALTGEVLDLVY